MNAHAGFNNGINYQPVQSTAASGYRQLASWDASPAGSCITAKVGSPTILRPNCSTNGRRALSRGPAAGCGATLRAATESCRASSTSLDPPLALRLLVLPSPTFRSARCLELRLRRTGGWAHPRHRSVIGRDLGAFSTGPDLIDGVVLIPCGIQTGSGTHQSWLTSIGVSDTGTALCNSLTPGAGDGTGPSAGVATALSCKQKAAALATASDDACDGEDGGAVVSCANAQVVVGSFGEPVHRAVQRSGASSGPRDREAGRHRWKPRSPMAWLPL